MLREYTIFILDTKSLKYTILLISPLICGANVSFQVSLKVQQLAFSLEKTNFIELDVLTLYLIFYFYFVHFFYRHLGI